MSPFWTDKKPLQNPERSDGGHSSNDLQFFTDCTFRASFSDYLKLINTFHFFPRNNGRGASPVD